MFGAPNGTMTLPSAAVASNTATARQNNGTMQDRLAQGASMWVFLALVALYLVWAIVQQHEKFRDQIQPKNLSANAHNLIMVWLTVIVSLGLSKILLTKAAAVGVPGADRLATVVQFAS